MYGGVLSKCRRTMQVKFQATPDQFKRVRNDVENTEATVRYDSSFGGVQEVSGTVQVNEQVLEPDTVTVASRVVDSGVVRSEKDGRELGELIHVEVTVDLETAVEAITKHWGGYDVDNGAEKSGDEIYVQYWEQADELHTGEETLLKA